MPVSVNVIVPALATPPPSPEATLSAIVEPLIVAVAPAALSIPPPVAAELPRRVMFVAVTVPALKIPPPWAAELPLTVTALSVSEAGPEV